MSEKICYISLIIIPILIFQSCLIKKEEVKNSITYDSIVLLQMVHKRDNAMKNKILDDAVSQFSDEATYINSAGYYFADLNEIESLHERIINNNYYGYNYEIGNISVRILTSDFAIVYYPWQITWHKIENPSQQQNETGLMTIFAKKEDKEWKWLAVTNQHTEDFFYILENHKERLYLRRYNPFNRDRRQIYYKKKIQIETEKINKVNLSN